MPEAAWTRVISLRHGHTIAREMNETIMTSSFLCLRFSCLLSSREAPALRLIAHSIKKRFRAQDKSRMRSDGAGAGTPSLRGVGRREAEAERGRVGEARVLG